MGRTLTSKTSFTLAEPAVHVYSPLSDCTHLSITNLESWTLCLDPDNIWAPVGDLHEGGDCLEDCLMIVGGTWRTARSPTIT